MATTRADVQAALDAVYAANEKEPYNHSAYEAASTALELAVLSYYGQAVGEHVRDWMCDLSDAPTLAEARRQLRDEEQSTLRGHIESLVWEATDPEYIEKLSRDISQSAKRLVGIDPEVDVPALVDELCAAAAREKVSMMAGAVPLPAPVETPDFADLVFPA